MLVIKNRKFNFHVPLRYVKFIEEEANSFLIEMYSTLIYVWREQLEMCIYPHEEWNSFIL